MLGPLPKAYRLVVTVSTLVAFMGLGALAGFRLPLAPVPGTGAGIGAAVGVVAALLLLRDFHTRPGPQQARVRNQRPRR
ncbi:MAG TPA: hypothetical protein VF049_21615 [Nocardioidaceae bacterium]|jgi:uncharacterized membrane protein YccC